jgi:hypothetical protein
MHIPYGMREEILITKFNKQGRRQYILLYILWLLSYIFILLTYDIWNEREEETFTVTVDQRF